MSHRRVTNIHLVSVDIQDTVYVLTTSKTASTNGCDLAPSVDTLSGDVSTVVASIGFQNPNPPSSHGYGSDNLRNVPSWRCPTCLQMGPRAMRGQRARVGVHLTALQIPQVPIDVLCDRAECAAAFPSPEFHRRPWIGHIDLAGNQLSTEMEVLGHTCQNPPRRFLNTCINTASGQTVRSTSDRRCSPAYPGIRPGERCL
jgi:hypothetical protein